jgi:hypothetical protein
VRKLIIGKTLLQGSMQRATIPIARQSSEVRMLPSPYGFGLAGFFVPADPVAVAS